jgi:serine/threonine protein kinase
VDKRSDIWAFGCVLYELLCGRPTFEGEDVTEILAAVVKTEPDCYVQASAQSFEKLENGDGFGFDRAFHHQLARGI